MNTPPTDTFERLLGETRISIREAANLLGVRCAETVRVWARLGRPVRGDARYVRLEAVLLGRSFWTTREAVMRFAAAFTTGGEPAPAAPTVTAADRKKSAAALKRRLRELGVNADW